MVKCGNQKSIRTWRIRDNLAVLDYIHMDCTMFVQAIDSHQYDTGHMTLVTRLWSHDLGHMLRGQMSHVRSPLQRSY
jgi:hypothetical protein